MKIVFLDRDGTLIAEPPDEQVDSLEKLEFVPGIITGLRMLVDRGFRLVLVTNQDGLGTPSYPLTAYHAVQEKIVKLLDGEGIRFDHIFVCPHAAGDSCSCRKPKTGLVDNLLASVPLDRDRSFMIGDRETDVTFAENIGIRSIRLFTDGPSRASYTALSFPDACRYIVRSLRSASVRRTTAETEVSVRVSLDGTGTAGIDTGVGFFDHMLAQMAKHSLVDLDVTVKGDLKVDEHHTVEDTGLALGEALARALGEKRGIQRYGFVLPMDESLAQAALDLGGRPYLSFHAEFQRERVGGLPTELVEDFFRALADGLRANLHLSVRGRNDHHKIEALFKATARALRQAIAQDERAPASIPSTKGVL
jgi:imidazoleglycerol-phosphate dehydratase/histidinol-phosphatase